MKIGIVGLGLIGGSLGLDLKQRGHQIYGVALQQDTCEAAVAKGAVDTASPQLASLASVDVVFICTPIAAIATVVETLAPHLQPDAIVTDVGSVKGTVVEAATRHWPRFVGGHPMAGKTEVGLAAAEPSLFAGRAYVLTPVAATPPDAVTTIRTLAQSLQAEVLTCSPAIHDRAVAWISHLPVMISSNLIQTCLREPDSTVRQLAQQLASSGFRDTSRVGGGNPELGVMMARYNRQEVLRSLHSYREQLNGLIATLETEDWATLTAQLQENQQVRPEYL